MLNHDVSCRFCCKQSLSSWECIPIVLVCCRCLVAQSCQTLCDPINCSMLGFPVLHHLPEFTQTHVHWVSDAIQPSHSLLFLYTPAFSLSQHQGLFQWVGSLHRVAKVLETQHRSFQRIFRIDFLSDWLVWNPCCPRDSQIYWTFLWLIGVGFFSNASPHLSI